MIISNSCYPTKLRRLQKVAVLTSLFLGVLIFLLCLGTAIYGLTHPDPRGSDYNGWVLFGIIAGFMCALFIGIPLIAIAGISRRWPGTAALISLGLAFFTLSTFIGIVFIAPAILNAIVWRMTRTVNHVELQQNGRY